MSLLILKVSLLQVPASPAVTVAGEGRRAWLKAGWRATDHPGRGLNVFAVARFSLSQWERNNYDVMLPPRVQKVQSGGEEHKRGAPRALFPFFSSELHFPTHPHLPLLSARPPARPCEEVRRAEAGMWAAVLISG
ncbi:hypothetical protein E2C01_029103 [Portunus trituberculatus]|uniref:Uncharacterized protein n=1 Tax=Portunus trituberculatus TaxID=210409 RepID=A0A5B7ETS0_PORTR|nr:hypothetical protein [Portunus trituberculatus]